MLLSILKSILQRIFKFKGYSLVKQYEIQHIHDKYHQALVELYATLGEYGVHKIQIDKRRLKLLSGLYGTGFIEAAYLVGFLQKSLKLKGDVCEFGIANGATSALIANEILRTSKKLWLFDSFSGLSRPTRDDRLLNDIFGYGSMGKYEGSMSYKESEVLGRLKEVQFPLSRVNLVRGYIEKTVKEKNMPAQVCFAYLDFDLYRPTKIALDFLISRINKGSYILVDDYGFFSSGVKKAVDEFIKENKNEFVASFPKKFAGHFCILQKRKK